MCSILPRKILFQDQKEAPHPIVTSRLRIKNTSLLWLLIQILILRNWIDNKQKRLRIMMQWKFSVILPVEIKEQFSPHMKSNKVNSQAWNTNVRSARFPKENSGWYILLLKEWSQKWDLKPEEVAYYNRKSSPQSLQGRFTRANFSHYPCIRKCIGRRRTKIIPRDHFFTAPIAFNEPLNSNRTKTDTPMLSLLLERRNFSGHSLVTSFDQGASPITELKLSFSEQKGTAGTEHHDHGRFRARKHMSSHGSLQKERLIRLIKQWFMASLIHDLSEFYACSMGLLSSHWLVKL